MTIESINIGAPFFNIKSIKNETEYSVTDKTILLNLSPSPIIIQQQHLNMLQSVIVKDTDIHQLHLAILIENFTNHESDDLLMQQIREAWPSAFDIRGEERLRGIEHYMSPKQWLGQFGFTLYHSASVPLNVGLHREHPFCDVPGYREVHTQIIGFGKMQQCHERDVNSLYLEETMAPGNTHRPMYDEAGNYPWHQFETITPSVFMAVEMLPDGAKPPKL